MTGRELYDKLRQFGDLDISEATTIGWIDNAQKRLSLKLPIAKEIEVNDVYPGKEVVVTGGIIDILSASNGYPLNSIEVLANKIIFNEAIDHVTIRYSHMAPKYTKLEDSLVIHESLQSPIINYLISMYYDMEGEGDIEESGLAERYYQRWLYDTEIALQLIDGTPFDTTLKSPADTKDVFYKKLGRRNKMVGDFYE